MRFATLICSAIAVFLLAALTRSQDPVESRPSDAVLARLEILEKQMTQVQTWIQAQAKQAEALAAALDTSEKEGFIYGINPKSREVLLVAFRAHAATLREAVPGQAPATAEDAAKGEAEKGGR
ncbi:MAG: hypothetical protein IPN34_24095 [Planctomycetes bacterium]|nr:hypothetical protein [Planctomycetota bacterium]